MNLLLCVALLVAAGCGDGGAAALDVPDQALAADMDVDAAAADMDVDAAPGVEITGPSAVEAVWGGGVGLGV